MKLFEDDVVTMDPAIKARWVDELRNGGRAQGMGKLQSCNDKFCCLGVLSDLAVDAGVIEKQLTNEFYFFDPEFNREYAALPKSVMDWANIRAESGTTRYGRLPFDIRSGSQAYLDDLNDSGMPFSQIADVIEFWY